MLYKKIMVATDGSDLSNNALQEAIQLATDQKAHLRIVYVVDEGFVYHGGPGFDYSLILKAFKEEGQKILDKTAAIVSKQSSIKFDTTLIELNPFQGRVSEVIVEKAKEWPADLLVIGTHGRRGLSHLFLGSVAEQIIRTATMPVLLIRGQST
ncbi:MULTISPECIES: universal stress protein [unclassified Legionella]|uniref:universal stress protein n=1 Tax=unclassified Legionella TaxID=2622702 RepID=UPI001E514CFA|nr:universal stress protein [Legionella sp. 31fI33]MCC5014811.1 universal stress protein [Legionella sp. 31fI33]